MNIVDDQNVVQLRRRATEPQDVVDSLDMDAIEDLVVIAIDRNGHTTCFTTPITYQSLNYALDATKFALFFEAE